MTRSDNTPSVTKRRRQALLAGVFGLALAGVVAGQFVPPINAPALAQITTSQPAGTFSFADIVERSPRPSSP